MLTAKRGTEGEEEAVAPRYNTRLNVNITKLPTFNGNNGNTSKILGFLIVYRLYIRMKMRNALVKKQI